MCCISIYSVKDKTTSLIVWQIEGVAAASEQFSPSYFVAAHVLIAKSLNFIWMGVKQKIKE